MKGEADSDGSQMNEGRAFLSLSLSLTILHVWTIGCVYVLSLEAL